MIVSKAAIKVLPQVLNMQVRRINVIGGPPRHHVAFAEKVIHGLIITGALLAGPVWVGINFENYRNKT